MPSSSTVRPSLPSFPTARSPVERARGTSKASSLPASSTCKRMAAAGSAGLTGVTHLFNAMPPLAGRDPGLVGAGLDDPGLFVGLIVDLFHVSATSLRVALAAKGSERMMLVTDAMPSVGSDLTTFEIDGNTITRHAGGLTRADGTIAGSDLDMATAVRNCVSRLGLP